MKLVTGRYRSEPLWVPARRLMATQVDARVLEWLLDPASLTQRLIERCGDRFYVRVDQQHWTRPLRGERRALGLRDDRYARVRKVRLMCGAHALVYARTVIPAATLTGRERRFAALGSRPLGAYLFRGRDVARCRIEFARIEPGQRLFDDAVRDLPQRPAAIWGRRSLFMVAGKPLLVNEIFLPAIIDLARPD